MSFAPEFTNQVEPPVPVLPVSLVKTEVPMVIKNERPESEIVEIGADDIRDSSESEKEIIPDVKDIDIALNQIWEDSIKSETVPTNMLEIKHSECVETQSLFTKTITTRNKIENTSDENGSWGTGQGVVEIQGSNERSNLIYNLEINEQLVLNSSGDLKGISTSSRKTKHSEKIDFARCHKTDETTSWEKEKEKIKVIRASVIPVEPHEYTSLDKNKHVCNHCQLTFKVLRDLKRHIKKLHRKVTTMYECPYCPFKSKWSVRRHIIQKHKSDKDIQWFPCHLCDMKFKTKSHLTRHMQIVHFTHKQMQNWSELCLVCGKRRTYKKYEKRYCSEKCALVSGKFYKTKAKTDDQHLKYHCDKCNYKTYHLQNFNKHKIIHLKPEERECFHCYHCSNKYMDKGTLKVHIFKHYRNRDVPFHCYICDFMALEREMIIEHLKKHSKHHSKLDEIKYKYQLETSQKRENRYRCDECCYKTFELAHMNRHKLTHLKPKEIEYFYCHHCSHKSKLKEDLRPHILRHFRNEDVPFHCYICDFMTQKRDLIIAHIRKHFKNPKKFDEIISKYQLETRIKKTEKRYCCDKCDYQTYDRRSLENHKIVHLKPEETQYFHCYHCSFKSKYKPNLRLHILMHFRNGDVPFHCHTCDFMTPKRELIVEHLNNHSKRHSKCDETKYNYQLKTSMEKLQKRHCCDKCNYKTYVRRDLTKHKIIHLKPEETQYIYCHHCSFKSKYKQNLKTHMLSHFRNEDIPFHCYMCDFMTLKRDMIIKHLKKHSKHHSKLDEIKYKYQLETSKKPENRYRCKECDYKTYMHRNFKRHKLIHLKPEEIEYFYCHHCSYKYKQKETLKGHIFKHFRNGDVPFHCHICDFMTLKRDKIIEHFKKHSKHHSKSDETKY